MHTAPEPRMALLLTRSLPRCVASPCVAAVQFDEKLGNGAFKEVYLSYDTETGKEVAW